MNDTMILQASLERIAIYLERVNKTLDLLVRATQPVQVAETAPAPIIEPTPIAEPVQPEPVKVEEPPKPSVTIDQIRKMVVTLSAMGAEKKDAVRGFTEMAVHRWFRLTV